MVGVLNNTEWSPPFGCYVFLVGEMFDSAGSPLDSYSNGGPWQVPLKHGQAQNKNETGVLLQSMAA